MKTDKDYNLVFLISISDVPSNPQPDFEWSRPQILVYRKKLETLISFNIMRRCGIILE